MPRGRNLKDDGKGRPGSKPAPPPPHPPLPPVTQDWLEATGQAPPRTDPGLTFLDTLCEPGAGRYSVNRDSNGNAYHKWRYNGGRWAGHYVMYVGDKYEPVSAGLAGLEHKLHLVSLGRLKPTLDKYH